MTMSDDQDFDGPHRAILQKMHGAGERFFRQPRTGPTPVSQRYRGPLKEIGEANGVTVQGLTARIPPQFFVPPSACIRAWA